MAGPGRLHLHRSASTPVRAHPYAYFPPSQAPFSRLSGYHLPYQPDCHLRRRAGNIAGHGFVGVLERTRPSPLMVRTPAMPIIPTRTRLDREPEAFPEPHLAMYRPMKIPSGIPSTGHAAFWAFMPIHKRMFSRCESARVQVEGEVQATNQGQEGEVFTILKSPRPP